MPRHIQGAQDGVAGNAGHGIWYKDAHDYPNQYVEQQELPTELLGERFYEPSDNGYEHQIREHFRKIKGDLPEMPGSDTRTE